MKKALLYGLLGAGLAILPCYGAVTSQTDWLAEPVLAADYEKETLKDDIHYLIEYVTVEPEPISGTEPTETMVRTRDGDFTQTWWEIDHVNDPDLPDELEEAAYIYGEMFSVCPEFLEAICDKETGGTYREDLIDSTGLCRGPMQINVHAQRERIAAYGLTDEDMLTYDGAMIVAASYVAELFDKYEDPAVVLMRYNGATTALKEYEKNGILNHYTEYVLDRSRELEEYHALLMEARKQ